jgi:hypothetical protein
MPMYIVKVKRTRTESVSVMTSALTDADAKKNAIKMVSKSNLYRNRPIEWAPGPTSQEAEIVKRTSAPDTTAFLEKTSRTKYLNKRRRANAKP